MKIKNTTYWRMPAPDGTMIPMSDDAKKLIESINSLFKDIGIDFKSYLMCEMN